MFDVISGEAANQTALVKCQQTVKDSWTAVWKLEYVGNDRSELIGKQVDGRSKTTC